MQSSQSHAGRPSWQERQWIPLCTVTAAGIVPKTKSIVLPTLAPWCVEPSLRATSLPRRGSSTRRVAIGSPDGLATETPVPSKRRPHCSVLDGLKSGEGPSSAG